MNATQEQWRPVIGHEGAYEVSDHGRVRSLSRTLETSVGPRAHHGRVLRPGTQYGRKFVNLAGRDVRLVHHLVLEAFVGPRPDGMECCHNNGDPSDNRLENLRWDTSSSNKRDQLAHGTHSNASKTHCPKGHAYTLENTRHYTYPSGVNARFCRTCDRNRQRKAG